MRRVRFSCIFCIIIIENLYIKVKLRMLTDLRHQKYLNEIKISILYMYVSIMLYRVNRLYLHHSYFSVDDTTIKSCPLGQSLNSLNSRNH